jgi:FkbM family methyltransferase
MTQWSELPADFPERKRVLLTASCRDCDDLPRAPDAGSCGRDAQGDYQVMHNGIRVVRGGYYGEWMEEIIRRLRGVHEPQEERIFHEVIARLPAGATMLELGGFWAWYSLWFQHAVPGGHSFVVEPDPAHLAVGRANFARNGCAATFTQACVGASSVPALRFRCESDGLEHTIEQVGLVDFLERHGIERLDLLHADVQGAETALLEGARACLEARRIRFVFVSTHHHLISGDPLTHQRCLALLRDAGAAVLVEHSVAESFSGDGLIVASFDPRDADLARIQISRARACDGIFREIEYDLDEAWAKLRKRRERRERKALRPHRRVARWLGLSGR